MKLLPKEYLDEGEDEEGAVVQLQWARTSEVPHALVGEVPACTLALAICQAAVAAVEMLVVVELRRTAVNEDAQ